MYKTDANQSLIRVLLCNFHFGWTTKSVDYFPRYSEPPLFTTKSNFIHIQRIIEEVPP